MSRAKQVCVGVAAAGLFGLGTTVATAVATADTGNSNAGASSSSAKASSANPGPKARTRAQAETRRTPAAVSQPASATRKSAARTTTSPAAEALSVTSALSSAPGASSTAASSPASSAVPTGIGRSRRGAVITATASAAAAAGGGQVTALADGVPQHVLLIGIDGTNLSAILADPYNQNLFGLMQGGTTGAASMMGHTTISDPSWSGITTGVWSEVLGLTNNVFTPWTYDKYPTIFNQLETYLPNVNTSVIADWANIAQIGGAGSIPADKILYYPQINNSWLDTDDEVGVASTNEILNTAAGTPSFQFSYFVGVDDTGHEFNAGSPQYAAALRNVDDNVGAMLNAVNDWETANPGEKWTVLVVTDHGQVPWNTLGIYGTQMRAHGFQTPYETTAFVIANGPDFTAGAVNNTYLNIDIAPTVSKLFGLTPEPYSQGKPLMDRAINDYQPVDPSPDALRKSLQDAIAMYGYPDVATNIALQVRTLASFIPYFVYAAFDGLTADMAPGPLKLAIQFVGAVLYQAVNIPTQIIVRLTGVTGNQIIPPDLWPYTPVPGTQTEPPVPANQSAEAIAV